MIISVCKVGNRVQRKNCVLCACACVCECMCVGQCGRKDVTRSARDRPVEASIVPASRARTLLKNSEQKADTNKPSVLQMSSRRRKLLRCLSASFREQLQEYVRQEFDCSRIVRMATKCSLFRSYSLEQSTMTISTRPPRYNDTNQALLRWYTRVIGEFLTLSL